MTGYLGVRLAEKIHKASKMGMLALQTVMTKTRDKNLSHDLNRIITTYSGIWDKARELLHGRHGEPENEPVVWGAVELTALPDSSPTRIAEILINGCTMDIVEITKKINEDETAEPELKQLAKELIEADQSTIETLRKYL